MSLIVHSRAGSLRPAAWSGVLALSLMAADAVAEGVTLRLERMLSEHLPATLDEGTAILLRFGSSEIEQQIRLTRERIARLERTNEKLEAAVRSGDELSAVLRTLQGLQGRIQESVREAMVARVETSVPATQGLAPPVGVSDAQSVARPVARPAAQSTPELAGTPDAQGVPRLAQTPAAQSTVERAAAPAAESSAQQVDTPAARTRVRVPAGADASRFEVPMAGLPRWVVGGVVGVIILALLGWMALRFLARRKAGSDLSEPDSWAAATDDVPRTPAAAADAAVDTAAVGDVTVDLDAAPPRADPVPAAGSQSAKPAEKTDERWSSTVISRKAADPQALREVDTLIAFEQFDKAQALLEEMLVAEPDNPELVLRHYHVRTQGGSETTDDDEALLKAMMDGPLSDTMLRVRNLGRGLMPGDPLFDDPAKRAAASQVLKASKRSEAADEHTDDTVVQFTGTVKLDRSPLAGN